MVSGLTVFTNISPAVFVKLFMITNLNIFTVPCVLVVVIESLGNVLSLFVMSSFINIIKGYILPLFPVQGNFPCNVHYIPD